MNITILLQGYSTSAEQLKSDVEYYKELGMNVVVSSYRECTNLLSPEIVVNNDEGKGTTLKDGFQGNNLKQNKKGNFSVVTEHPFFRTDDFNLNFQIHTVKKGLEKINILYPDTEYILKLRADMKLFDIHKHINEWVTNMDTDADFLEKKIVVKGAPGLSDRKKWKVYDFWTFGTAKDIQNYYDLPYVGSKIAPEYYLTEYIRKNSNDAWDVAKNAYFYYDDNKVPTYWHKYNGWLDTSDEKGFVGIYERHIKSIRPY